MDDNVDTAHVGDVLALTISGVGGSEAIAEVGVISEALRVLVMSVTHYDRTGHDSLSS